MKKVLVTGAGGFIGSHLTEKLVENGYDVRAFIHYNSNASSGWLDSSPAKSSVELFFGDVRDVYGVRRAVKGCHTVYHLAALIGIPYSYYSPESYIETNITGTLNILQAAREYDVSKVVHTSTSEVYGTALRVPISEDHPVQAQSPYAASKVGADQIALSFYKSFATPVGIIRPFNTYGPRQSLRAVIPTIITQALSRSAVVLGDLRPTRDFTYVTDTVAAFILMAESTDTCGTVINVGSNREVTIGNLAETIMQQIGKPLPVATDRERIRPEMSEVQRLWCDNTLAYQLLGWKPEVSLIDGIFQTVAWYGPRLTNYALQQYTI